MFLRAQQNLKLGWRSASVMKRANCWMVSETNRLSPALREQRMLTKYKKEEIGERESGVGREKKERWRVGSV